MPSLEWNHETWNGWQWGGAGEEWSARWGGSRTQWLSCIYPRLAPFLPARSVLEIAPGYGRWTQYLLPRCEAYMGVDLAEFCVQACQERFAAELHATFVVNDGLTLPMVADRSVDLVFSFDSLVHAEADVISSYLREVRRILSPNGVAFIHHSNVGIYHRTAAVRNLVGMPLGYGGPFTVRLGLAFWNHDRGRTMTAARFATSAREAGLACFAQETIGWASPLLIDCISVVAHPGSRWDQTPTYARNRKFYAAAPSSHAASRVFNFEPVISSTPRQVR